MTTIRTEWELLTLAISIVSEAFVNTFDKGGKPYVLHCMRVMNAVSHHEDPELMQIAILHDLIEDTDWEIQDLSKKGFSNRVLYALELVTKTKKANYEDYITRIGNNDDAARVKLADLEDNTDVTRLKGIEEKDFERMKKYHKSYMYLKDCVNY